MSKAQLNGRAEYSPLIPIALIVLNFCWLEGRGCIINIGRNCERVHGFGRERLKCNEQNTEQAHLDFYESTIFNYL